MRACGGKSNLRDARERLVFFVGLLKERERREGRWALRTVLVSGPKSRKAGQATSRGSCGDVKGERVKGGCGV
jgi:hypothetical protein